MKRKTSKKTNKWFTKVRGSYLPTSTVGWLTYLPYLSYLLGSLVIVLRLGYSFWLGVLILVPNWVAAAAVMNWIAANRS